jgi:hypothetical protein
MLQAIVKKELRELWAFAAVALALVTACVCRQTGIWSRFLVWLFDWLPGLGDSTALLPFIQRGFGMPYGLAAILLGIRQSCGAQERESAPYLLQLPLRRHTLVLTRLLTGLGLQMAVMLLPLLFYAGWAARSGTHPAPFEWTMAVPAIRLWLIIPLVYLGAFASGIRPARWAGSRLLPLLGITIPAVVVYNASLAVALPLLAAIVAALAIEIVYEAETRDYP